MKVYGSSSVTASVRAASSDSSTPRPFSRSSSRLIASPVSPDGSIATTKRSSGSRSRTSAILAYCSAFSTMMAADSELPATHSHSSGELVA